MKKQEHTKHMTQHNRNKNTQNNTINNIVSFYKHMVDHSFVFIGFRCCVWRVICVSKYVYKKTMLLIVLFCVCLFLLCCVMCFVCSYFFIEVPVVFVNLRFLFQFTDNISKLLVEMSKNLACAISRNLLFWPWSFVLGLVGLG